MLDKGIKLFQEGKFQEALPILEAYAHENELVAMLAAQAAKKTGDADGCKRYLFMAANKFGSGDAALMLAQEYAAEENYAPALIWTEQAIQKKTRGAGMLALRLSEKTGQWDKCLRLALEDLRWMDGYERFELCDEIHTLLEGNHYEDQVIVDLVEPILPSLDADPPAKDLLEKSCRNAKERISRVEDQVRKHREEADLLQKAQQNRETAKAEAKRKAAEAVKLAKRASRARERKAAAKDVSLHFVQKLMVAAVFLSMPLLTNGLAHWILTQGEVGFGYVFGAIPLGYVCVWLCTSLMSKSLHGESYDMLLFVWLSPIQLSILWLPLGFVLELILEQTAAIPIFQGDYLLEMPLIMGIVNCYLQEIRILINRGEVTLD